ncbi:MAG: hypothetical protein ACRET4_16630, partial [Steroidobacteraceae bacterium]
MIRRDREETAAVTTECTAGIDAVAPRDDEWRALTIGMAPALRFVTAAWFRDWGKSFLPHQNWLPPLRYATVRARDGRLLAVFPVATVRQFGVSAAALGGFYWPFRSPVIPEEVRTETIDALAAAFTECGAMAALRYGPTPEAHAAIDRFNIALKERGWRVRCASLGETYAVDLPETWERFEQGMSKKLRSNVAYDERRMQRDGVLEISRSRNIAGEPWREAIRELGKIEAKS